MIDEILKKYQLDFDELSSEERSTLLTMVDSAQNNTLTVEKIKTYIDSLKGIVESELAERKEAPQNWLSLLTLLIPLIGIVRKWYQDQRTIYLQARLRNLVLLSDAIARPDRARADLEAAVGNLANAIKTQHGMKVR